MDQPEQTLFEVQPTTGPKGVLRTAAETTIAAKRAAGLLDDGHDLTVALILELASAVDRGLTWGKVSVATTTLAKELREAMASLPSPEVAGAGGAWEQIVAELSE